MPANNKKAVVTVAMCKNKTCSWSTEERTVTLPTVGSDLVAIPTLACTCGAVALVKHVVFNVKA